MVQTGTIQTLDALRREQVAVGNHARQNAVAANVPHNFLQMRVQQRLASAEGNDRGAELRQDISDNKGVTGKSPKSRKDISC
jgi:hypothetical protein